MECVFLDWRRPGLPAAARYLAERFAAGGALDLRNVVVAVPGGRAGRRLLELLVELADEGRLRLSPPRIVTVGHLPELLYEAKRPFAGDLAQQLAWVEALQSSDAAVLAAAGAAPPDKNDLPAWLALGHMLAGLHRELAADALNFAAVADCGGQLPGFQETARWQALAEIQQRYLAMLDGLDLWDLQTARLYALRQGNAEPRAPRAFGTVDLNRSQRLMLDQVAGRPRPWYWPRRSWPTASTAMAASARRRGWTYRWRWRTGRSRSPTIRLPRRRPWPGRSAALGPLQPRADHRGRARRADRALHRASLAAVRGPPPLRRGHCRSWASGPYRLLAAVADYVEDDRFAALAALVRHPGVHDGSDRQGLRGD